jgi:hypothetical protein
MLSFRSCLTMAILVVAWGSSFAADQLAVWQYGAGTIAAQPAEIGALIPAEALIASDTEMVRVTLAEAPQCHLTLSPHSRMHLTAADGHLFVYLDEGVLQANIGNKGPYSDVHVLGAAIDVRVTGTLFVVERVKGDTDYVALVEGRVRVNPRRDVALALSEQTHAIDLTARQGLGGTVQGGLMAVDTLTGRPQLTTGGGRGVQQNAMTKVGGWDEDVAMALTNGFMFDDLSHPIADQLRSQISDQVSHEVVTEVTKQVTDTIVLQIIGGAAQPLAGPPTPPQ